MYKTSLECFKVFSAAFASPGRAYSIFSLRFFNFFVSFRLSPVYVTTAAIKKTGHKSGNIKANGTANTAVTPAFTIAFALNCSGVKGISALARSLASEILLYSFICIIFASLTDNPDSHSSAADSFLLRFFRRLLTALEVLIYGILKISNDTSIKPADSTAQKTIFKNTFNPSLSQAWYISSLE